MSEEMDKVKVKALVVTDGVFDKQCENSSDYVGRLKQAVNSKPNKEVELISFPGSHGICDIDPSVTSLELDTKNKTVFIQSLENNSGLFDELIIIKDAEDMFVNGAKQKVTELCKPIYTYGYKRKVK